SDQTVRVWDLQSASEPKVLTGHTGPVSSVSFSPDGQRVASASDDQTVRVWDLQGASAPKILTGHTDSVLSVNFSPDGQCVTSASDDGTVRVLHMKLEPKVTVEKVWVFGQQGGGLTFDGANFKGVRGLQAGQKVLIKQRGGVLGGDNDDRKNDQL
ncbi:MAG: hypothetical protein AAF310_05555, partial [Myxococcota bacterium]